MRRRRRPPEVFQLPVDKLRDGWYVDVTVDGLRPNPRLERVE